MSHYFSCMCGRYVINLTEKQLRKLEKIAQAEVDVEKFLKPHFNVAPSQKNIVVRKGSIDEMVWGLVPSWSKERNTKFSTINARSESISEKPTYRNAFKNRRCIVPATGYYEWRVNTKPKIPYYFYPVEDDVFYFAGIWDRWRDLNTYSVVTTEASESIRKIHHRMPVILDKSDVALWLEGSIDEVESLMQPANMSIKFHTVSTDVNKITNDSPDLIRSTKAADNELQLPL